LTIPSLVRSWLVDCKDKNLFTSVTTYTATHFSPVIIDTELSHIKSPEGLEELNSENLTVKVASAVNEVTAAYNVDEHQLELTLKIPSDWPLQRVTVKDSKRVGVAENRWRGWLLGVQQIVWSQVRVCVGLASGHLLIEPIRTDGLSMRSAFSRKMSRCTSRARLSARSAIRKGFSLFTANVGGEKGLTPVPFQHHQPF